MAHNITVIYFALTHLGIPVFLHDLVRLCSSNYIPYLNVLDSIPSFLRKTIFESPCSGVSTWSIPSDFRLRLLTGFFARELHFRCGLRLHPLPFKQLLYRITQRWQLGPEYYRWCVQASKLIGLDWGWEQVYGLNRDPSARDPEICLLSICEIGVGVYRNHCLRRLDSFFANSDDNFSQDGNINSYSNMRDSKEQSVLEITANISEGIEKQNSSTSTSSTVDEKTVDEKNEKDAFNGFANNSFWKPNTDVFLSDVDFSQDESGSEEQNGKENSGKNSTGSGSDCGSDYEKDFIDETICATEDKIHKIYGARESQMRELNKLGSYKYKSIEDVPLLYPEIIRFATERPAEFSEFMIKNTTSACPTYNSEVIEKNQVEGQKLSNIILSALGEERKKPPPHRKSKLMQPEQDEISPSLHSVLAPRKTKPMIDQSSNEIRHDIQTVVGCEWPSYHKCARRIATLFDQVIPDTLDLA